MKATATLSFILICFFLNSCVSNSEHDKVLSEKAAIETERNALKKELDEIKFGAPNLLSDGKKFFEAKNYSQSRQKLQMLVDKHPDMPQSIEAKKILFLIDEEELWERAFLSENTSVTQEYINKYPEGKYISKAKSREEYLKDLNMQKEYDAALNQKSSHAWKNFLETYPNHPEREKIKEQMIRLQVEEIYGDSRTGKMPSFNQTNYGYSESSSVSIKNDTGCELTVWYSGPEAEMINIPIGSSKTVYLSSGSYRVAASACGSNYAGSESLSGSYSSTFYISTSRY